MNEGSERPACADDATQEIYRLWRLMSHTCFLMSRLREQELARFNITPEQAYVLNILNGSNGTSTLNDIVALTGRQHHSISTLVRRMIDQGLVVRFTNAKDRRKFDIHITPKGQALFDSITRDSLIEVFSVLDQSQKREMEAGIIQLLKSVYRVMGEPEKSEILSILLEPFE